MTRLLSPLALWGRLGVSGRDAVPAEGAVLVVGNHDSQFDPVVLALALRAMNQIPIERGAGDAGALTAAVDALRAGQAVCIFPEGKLSLGRALRARSGAGRLLEAAPGTVVVLARAKVTA